jgi:dTDP-4-dehydrorhamnose 3,5-epimerase
MTSRPLAIEGAWEFEALTFPDDRGSFAVWYEEESFAAATGYALPLSKTHHAQSRRGTIRGVHFTMLPPGQAKYVYCTSGRLLDVVVDVRVGSPTFGQWDSVVLDASEGRCVFLSDGLGHAYAALEDDTALIYLCTTPYAPDREVAVDLFDPALGLPWPDDVEPVLSDRDKVAPSLAEAAEQGLLPTYEDYLAHVRRLRAA